MRKYFIVSWFVTGIMFVSAGPTYAVDGSGVAASPVSIDRITGPEAGAAAGNVLAKLQETRKEPERSSVGEGYEVFEIEAGKLLSIDQIQDVSVLYLPTGMWVFPVKPNSGDNPRSVITIGRKGGRLTVDHETGINHAKNLVSLAAAWPRTKGYDYRIINAPELDIRLIEVSGDGEVLGLVASYSSADAAFDPSALRDPRTVILDIRNTLKVFTESRRWR